MQCSALHCSGVQCGAVQCCAVQCCAVQFSFRKKELKLSTVLSLVADTVGLPTILPSLPNREKHGLTVHPTVQPTVQCSAIYSVTVLQGSVARKDKYSAVQYDAQQCSTLLYNILHEPKTYNYTARRGKKSVFCELCN